MLIMSKILKHRKYFTTISCLLTVIIVYFAILMWIGRFSFKCNLLMCQPVVDYLY